MSAANDNRLHVVEVDIYTARRKRIHSIISPAGVPAFHAPHIMQVLDWLAEQDVTRARFTDDETSYDVTFRPCANVDPPTGE